jgi:hypothetical protein
MRIKYVGHIAHIGEMRNACEVLVGKPEEKIADRAVKVKVKLSLCLTKTYGGSGCIDPSILYLGTSRR